MYFVSDQTNGIANLYTMKLETKAITPVTKYADFDVMMPNTDGKSIVYVQDGYLHVFDVAAAKDAKIAVSVPSDRWALRNRVINPRDYIHAANLSNDGQTVVLEARGDLFRVPTGAGAAENLSETPGTREMYPALSPDGKTVAFFCDKTGDYQLYTQPAAGGAWTPVTTDLDRTVYRLAWSPDGRKILFGNKDYSIFYVDLATKKPVKIDSSNQMKNDEFTWEMADYTWSPDCKVDRLQLRPDEPQQPDLPLQHRDREEGRRDDRLLRQPLPGLRRRRPVPLLRLQPQLRPAHGLLRGRPRRRHAPADHGRPAPRRRRAALRRRGGREERRKGRPRALPHRHGGPGQADVSSARPGRQLFLAQGRQGQGPLGLHRRIHRGGVRGHLQEQVRRDAVDAPRLRHGRPQGRRADGQDPRFLAVDEWRADPRPPRRRHLHDLRGQGLRVQVGGRQARPRRPASTRSTTRRSGARSSTTPGAGTATSSTTPACTATIGRPWARSYRAYIPFLSSRGELNWVLSQMVGELCVSHTYVGGGDYGPGEAPRSPVFTGLLGADLAPDMATGLYRWPGSTGRPTSTSTSRVRSSVPTSPSRRATSSWPSTARPSRPATTISSCSRRRPGRRSRSR